MVGRWRKVLIITEIAMVSFVDAIKVILGNFFSKNSESYIHGVIHSWARTILAILKVNYKICNHHGFQFLDNRPYVIMSNHCSHIDIPLIYEAFAKDRVAMIAKKELFRIPFFGWGMKLGGCVTLDRKNAHRAAQDLIVARNSMLAGMRLWIAPEGTRSTTGKMAPFKNGGFKVAREVKAIIVPVTIIGSNRVLPAKTLDFSLDEVVEVHIGRPLDTSSYGAKGLGCLVADTVREIAEKLPQ